jgi:hypothetical protein
LVHEVSTACDVSPSSGSSEAHFFTFGNMLDALPKERAMGKYGPGPSH